MDSLAAPSRSGFASAWRALSSWTPDPGSVADARGLSQRRVASFLKLLSALFGTFFVLDSIEHLLKGGLARVLQPRHLAHLALVLGLFVGFRWARRGERSRVALGMLEALATLSVAVTAVAVIHGLPRDATPAGPLLALSLTLVARAAIVPSTGLRTLLVGSAVTALVVSGYATRSDPSDEFQFFALVWLFAFTLASSYASRVIYGLQEQVRQASELGQYVLEEKLGDGGMGVVYRARHRLLRRPTAVKLISRGHGDDLQAARFEQEVRQTARLRHPNTVTVYDYGCTRDGVFYYAMELLEGATLGDVVAVGGPLPPARVVRIVAAVAGALAEAHGIQLSHRDVKPANVMLCEQGGASDVPKILDFGLVKDLEDGSDLTQTGALAGTPAYMSPESLRAPETVGPASDLYGLGAVAYFLLTGKPVFEGRTSLEVCSHHLLTTPVAPSERIGRAIPQALERLVLQCLAKAPEERPSSALELQGRLLALEGLGRWSATDARAWWAAHRESLARRARDRPHDQGAASPPRTLAIDVARRA